MKPNLVDVVTATANQKFQGSLESKDEKPSIPGGRHKKDEQKRQITFQLKGGRWYKTWKRRNQSSWPWDGSPFFSYFRFILGSQGHLLPRIEKHFTSVSKREVFPASFPPHSRSQHTDSRAMTRYVVQLLAGEIQSSVLLYSVPFKEVEQPSRHILSFFLRPNFLKIAYITKGLWPPYIGNRYMQIGRDFFV